MALAVFVAAAGLLGAAIARALSRTAVKPEASFAHRPYGDDAADLLDACARSLVLALAVALATSWALALAGALRPVPLVLCAALEIVAGAAWLHRMRDPEAKVYAAPSGRTALVIAIALWPVVLWTAFVAWRGTVLPVYNHDALAYHLPKAVLLAKAGHFQFFDVPESRIATWPCNYEILLADTMLLTGSDQFTAAVGTFSYVLFAVLAARLAAAWWGGGGHVALVAATVATAPLVVLHSGLHKNDLFLASASLAAFVWGARWAAAGCGPSAILATVALAIAAGTKVNAVFVVAGAVPLLVLGAVRRRVRPAVVAAFVGAAAALSALLGAATYVVNLAAVHRPFLSPALGQGSHLYGAVSNVWQYTAMVLIAPFSRFSYAVWNPFRGEYWWWPSNDIWMSHFGPLLSALALLVPVAVWRYRREGTSRNERTLASAAVLATYLLTLPLESRPIGFFGAYGRYVLFVAPVVAAWTLAPFARDVERIAERWRGREAMLPTLAPIALALAVAAFGVASLWLFGVEDEYAPIRWVAHELEHPDDRTPFVRHNRAASVFDAVAGPTEHCAIDAGFDTWVYPAYGRGWTRTVDFLRAAPPGETVIPDEAMWVIVDRTWNVFFGHPEFVDMGHARFLGHGRPSSEDLRVYRQLRRDPRFELVYEDREQNQALFRRKRGE
jgi:hypothetical protein